MNVETHKIKDVLLNFLIPLVCLGLTLLIFFLTIFPAINNLPSLRKELEAQLILENQLRSKITALNKLIDFSEELEENSNLMSKVLVSQPEVPLLLTQIDSIAKESGLLVNKLSYSLGEIQEEDSLVTYNSVNVSLGAISSYDQIGLFLRNLENSARWVDVSNYRYNEENAEDTKGLFNVTFILRSPYLAVNSLAVTDEPINIDIGDPEFVNVMNKLRSLRFYGTTIDEVFTNVSESSSSEVSGAIPEVVIPENQEIPSEVTELINQ